MALLCQEFTVDLVWIADLDLAQLCLASVKIKHLNPEVFAGWRVLPNKNAFEGAF